MKKKASTTADITLLYELFSLWIFQPNLVYVHMNYLHPMNCESEKKKKRKKNSNRLKSKIKNKDISSDKHIHLFSYTKKDVS